MDRIDNSIVVKDPFDAWWDEERGTSQEILDECEYDNMDDDLAQ